MADWRVIERTGETLARMLEARIAREFDDVEVVLASTSGLAEFSEVSVPTVSLLLYQVTENPQLRNAPRTRGPGSSLRRQPMALELCYLVTPWGVRGGESNRTDETATREEHRLLGMILQTFYDAAELGSAQLRQSEDGVRPVWSPTDGVQVVFETLSLDDQYRIWDAGELGYRVSLAYRVRVVGLDPLEELGGPPVREATFESGARA